MTKYLVKSLIIAISYILFLRLLVVDTYSDIIKFDSTYNKLHLYKENRSYDNYNLQKQIEIKNLQSRTNDYSNKNSNIKEKEYDRLDEEKPNEDKTNIKNNESFISQNEDIKVLTNEKKVEENRVNSSYISNKSEENNSSVVTEEVLNDTNVDNNQKTNIASDTENEDKDVIEITNMEEVNAIINTLPSIIREAYKTTEFKVQLNSGLGDGVLGTFNILDRTIYFKSSDKVITKEVVYHEFGHFVDFLWDNGIGAHGSEEFITVYEEEKSKFITENNLSYCISTREEYLAQGFYEYLCNPERLKQNTPKTYSYISNLINNINETMISETKNFLNSFCN